MSLSGTTAHGREVADVTSDLFRLVVRESKTIVELNKPPQGAPTLYCIHSVAGDVTDYRALASALKKEIGVCGVQVPLNRMQTDETVSVEKLAARYARLIGERQPSGHVLIGGFSAGAIIALEVAQQLITAGREVPLLVAFDGAPSNTAANLPKFHPVYLWRLVTNFCRCVASGQAKGWVRDGLLWRLAFSFFLKPSSGGPLALGSTFYKSAMMIVTERCGWKPEQALFLRRLVDALSVYEAAAYSGRVLVFETRFQPLFHVPQIGDVWRNLSSDNRCYDVDACHSSLFRDERAISAMASALIDEAGRIWGSTGRKTALK